MRVSTLYLPQMFYQSKFPVNCYNAISKKNKGLIVSMPVPGEVFNLGDVQGIILAPNS